MVATAAKTELDLMHPLDLFDRFRRALASLVRIGGLWDRSPADVAPEQSEDWLLEPVNQEEACLLFPQLEPDRAVLQYQRLRLEMRERDGRGF